MGDLLSLLTNASQSLTGAQGAAATAASNIQNVNTPGYSRQQANIETGLPGDLYNGVYLGQGSRLASVTQVRDRFLEAQVPYAFGQASYSKIKSEALGAVHTFDPGRPGGVGEALSGFFDSLRQLSQNPSDRTLRQGTVNAGKNLEIAFQRSARDIESARSGLDGKLSGLVDEVNRLAKQVSGLNKQIKLARLTSRAEPNDLLDSRQKAMDRLSELTGATQVPDEAGQVTLALPKGGALVSGEFSATLSTRVDSANNGHLKLMLTSSGSSTASAVSADSVSGEIGGLLSARDTALKTAMDDIDTLAFDLAAAVNAKHSAGMGLDGSTGNSLFTVGSTSTGAARLFSVNSAIAADPTLLATGRGAGSGDNAAVHDLVGLETTALPSGDAPVNALAAITGAFGAQAQEAKAAADHDGALREHLENMRDSVSGVSIDEEMVQMTKAQRAYEAISRVINTSNAMLDTLLKLGS